MIEKAKISDEQIYIQKLLHQYYLWVMGAPYKDNSDVNPMSIYETYNAIHEYYQSEYAKLMPLSEEAVLGEIFNGLREFFHGEMDRHRNQKLGTELESVFRHIVAHKDFGKDIAKAIMSLRTDEQPVSVEKVRENIAQILWRFKKEAEISDSAFKWVDEILSELRR